MRGSRFFPTFRSRFECGQRPSPRPIGELGLRHQPRELGPAAAYPAPRAVLGGPRWSAYTPYRSPSFLYSQDPSQNLAYNREFTRTIADHCVPRLDPLSPHAAWAAAQGLRASFPDDFPSWWFPGWTTLVLYEPGRPLQPRRPAAGIVKEETVGKIKLPTQADGTIAWDKLEVTIITTEAERPASMEERQRIIAGLELACTSRRD